MLFTPTDLSGVYLVDLERREDERGFFARSWCEEELRGQGLSPRLSQCSVSFNRLRGTLRGLHYQSAPHEEAKLVRCTSGRAFDVAVDLRPRSPTYRRWTSAELSARNHRALYVPEGCAHGFQTLEDGTEILYMISSPYRPDAARGVRWNDPAFAIRWPLDVALISPRDRDYPDFGGSS